MTRALSVPTKASMIALAVALVAGPSPASAQSFQGSVDSATGATVDQSTPGVTNVSITQQQAVINWTATNNPNDGTIVFQPDGTTANFFSGTDFAVLNRITPGTAGSAVYMGGTINSFAGDFTGGTVFFYSPNGIIIGQNASINVGSLGLTTLPIADDGQGNWMTGFGTSSPQVTFGQATIPNSFVRTNAAIDGSINAFGSGSYVAMVAPIVQHSGVIRTDGAAALVAAEAATITFSPDGLFTIQVTVGTDAATGIDVDGGTIERLNPQEGVGNHHAYLVAVAKNDAVDMLIRNGASIGFDTATSATVEDNVVVLSGGHQVSSGQTGARTGGRVDLGIDGAAFSTDVEAEISGGATINSNGGDTSFGLDPTSTSLDLRAGADSIITATNGNSLTIAGSLFASLDKDGTAASPTGNVLRLSANGTGSALSIGGNVILTSRVSGVGEDETGVDAADVTGGTVIVQNGAGSTIDITGSLGINVDASGGNVAGGGAAGGSATGGTAQIVANGGSGSGLTVTGPVSISASGLGGSVGSDCSADCGVTGGNGTGGNILLQASTISGSQLSLGGTVGLTATGEGGAGDVAAGNGSGGNVQLVSNDSGAIIVAGNLTADASGQGGFGMESSQGGGNGGNATGGLVQISFPGAASNIDLQGTSLFSADAFGGNAYGIGGNATGGFVNIQPRFGGTLTAGFIGASADASGGSSDIFDTGSDAAGGSATAGRAWLQMDSGGSAVVADLSLSANATGGQSQSGPGGVGTGGYVIASANNGALEITGTTDLEALGRGGLTSAGDSTGGLGTGGQADIFSSNNGTVTLGGTVSADATGRGGNYFSDGATGGNGVGGIVFFQANNGGTLDAASTVDLMADGIGGFSFGDCSLCGGTGGDGTGGTVTVQAFGGATTLMTVDGQLDASAAGFGSAGFAGAGGDGQGGTVRLGVQDGATVDLLSDLTLNATGNGGWQTNGGLAGNGTGGLVDVFVGATGGILDVAGFGDFAAFGFGGMVEGSGGTGGNGVGGTARLLALGGTSSFAGLFLDATGSGGDTASGTGGNGTGNHAQINASGGDIGIDGNALVDASGFGGSGTVGGTGTGGGNIASFTPGAIIRAQNGDIDIGFSASALSDGFGGQGTAGAGGTGTGGWASIQAAPGGTVDVLGTIEAGTFISADGIGGNSTGAAGGNAFGGTATAVATGGAMRLFGDLIASAEATGGSGTTGGNAVGRITPPAQEETTPALTLFVNNGGSIRVDGASSLSTRAAGGNASNGSGGNAQGGEIDVVAGVGTITLGTLIAVADAQGGSGGSGGAGGNSVGGNVDVGWTLSGSILGTITATDAFLSAIGEGGDGGAGVDGDSGTAGGAGGSGRGGEVFAIGSAAGGTLILGDSVALAQGFGGAGGDGGNGVAGTGGAGGAGGAAEGGFVQMGTISTNNIPTSGGGASYAAVLGDVSATGGDGGTSAGGNGNGGSGGAATGGTTLFFVRGVAVSADTIDLFANATGGDGGTGLALGNGGNAATGFIGVESKDRTGFPDERGLLTADAITGEAIATGGAGAANGTSTLRGGNLFRVLNGDAEIGSVALTFAGTLYDGTDGPDLISVRDGTATIAGNFSYSTTGELALDASNGAMTAGSIALSAATFVPDNVNPPPTSPGSYSADSFDISTGGDFVTNANLISTAPLVIDAPGLIDMADATSGGDLALIAGSTIDGGTQTAAGSVFASAPGNITLGNVVAGDSIDIFSSGGNLSLGFLSAANFITVEAAGSIGFGDVTADLFDFDAGGDVNGGDIIAGTEATGEAGGAVTLGDINVGILQTGGASEDGFAVGLVAAGAITVGNVDADEAIGFATLQDLTAGDLDSGVGVMTLIGGDTTIASITTPGGGLVYHGDAQMFLDAGGPDNFDPTLVLAQPPLQSGGSYTVTGAITTGQLQVAAASINTGAINASDSATLDAAGAVTTGAIDAGLLDIVAGTDITTGDIFSFGGVTMDAGGSIFAGDIDAGSIDLLAGADIDTGYLNTQLIFQLDGGVSALLFPGASITLEAGGDISTGDISSIDGVYANAGGSISTGAIDAIDFVEAHAGDSITTGNIDAGDYILLAADTGAITIGDATSGALFQASAGANLITGSVTASEIDASAGGTAAIDGAWSADYVQLVSSDINITANGSIAAAEIDLISSNATQTVVGDGVTGGGYQLADAEYDRLDSTDIDVIADAGGGAAPLMLIGDLSVAGTGGDGGSEYEFVTFDSEGDSVVGSIRIVGDALFSGMGANDGVAFTTNRFELDAATGLLSLESTPGTLGGVLYLDAAHIHVASGDILDQLAEEPQYDGYQDDLNAPAAVQRPDGVIRAGSIEIEFADGGQADLNTLYVQNTGTEDTPAGFLVSQAVLFGEGNEVTPPPGSIDLVINGQIVTDGGTLTGIDVRDALVEAEGDLTPFTDNSTINGCLLTGPCDGGGGGGGPFPPGLTPTPGIQDEIELINDGLLPPPKFGNEDFIDDNIEATVDGATSPITPPTPLFDTSALGNKGDVEDPVSGSGNPALMEKTSADEAACPAGGSQPAGQCKQEKQP